MPIPYGRQWITDADIAAVVEVLRSDWLTQGPKVEEFERRLADYVGAKHVIALSNGTAALHLALLAAKIGPGDRVVTSPNTFLASANAALYVGATPDFGDIHPGTLNLDVAKLEAHWQPDTKAVVAVDFAGRPSAGPELKALCERNGAVVVEDAAHSIGSKIQGQRVGGHPWADLTTFSFHPVKTITTGEGGAIATQDDALAARCRELRSHGMTKDLARFQGLGDGLIPESALGYYEMPEPGFNFRLTDLQAALGISQLSRLDEFVKRRAEIVARYDAAFAGQEFLRTPSPDADTAWHLYVARIDFAALGITRVDFMNRLKDLGVLTQVHYIPVHLQPYYRERFGYGPGKCPEAEAFYRECLSLPLYPAMTDADVETVIAAVMANVQI